MKAMILAAGGGSRLRPLTERCAKPVLPMANRPLLSYTLQLVAQAGVDEAVLNLHHCPESVVDALGDCCEGVRLHYSRETALRGTAGALLPVAAFFDETFLVVYGDNLLDVDLGSLIAVHRERGAMATLGLYHAPDPTQAGVVGADTGGWVTSYREKPTLEELQSSPYPARLGANAGIYVLEPEILQAIPTGGPADFGHDLFPLLVAERVPVAATYARGYIQDTGTFTGYRRAHSDLILGWLPRGWRPEEDRLWPWSPGVLVHETATVAVDARLGPPCLVGAGARIGPRACLGPNVCVGPRCVIEEEADLVETVIWAGTRIGPRAWSRHSVIAAGCDVGADTRLLDVAIGTGEVVAERERRLAAASLGLLETVP
jgi:mannose-1-phosphate guanylyltransferase/phosphomannomutase